MYKRIKTIPMLIILLISGSLAGCASGQESSDMKNTRSNDTSAFVRRHMNTRQFKTYTTAVTYNKINNTVEFHLNHKTVRELQGRTPNRYQDRITSSHDSKAFHKLIQRTMVRLHKQAHNRSVRTKLINH